VDVLKKVKTHLKMYQCPDGKLISNIFKAAKHVGIKEVFICNNCWKLHEKPADALACDCHKKQKVKK